jgi:hypothetical protein
MTKGFTRALLLGLVIAAAPSSSPAIAAGGKSAGACGTGKLLFADSFDAMTTSWGHADEFMKVQGGKLVMNEANGKFYVVDAGQTYSDVDYCAVVKLTQSSKLSGSYVGLTFWGQDVDHFYTLQITLDGYATVYQYTGDWKTIVKDRAVGSIKKGIGAENTLRVVTQGDSATFYINGQKFDAITGTPPSNGQHIGFTVEAPAKGKATFALDNVEVHAPG